MTRVAAVQMTSGDDIPVNLDAASVLIEEAVAATASLIVLPECFALMQRTRQQLRDHAECPGDGPIQAFLAGTSRSTGCWIIAGSVPLCSDDPGRVYNSLLVFDPSGENVARYDKIHLFDVSLESGESYRESDYTVPGRECVVQPTPAGMAGLSVCYDLRFPELYRRLAKQGAELLVVPSAFAVPTGRAHWETLLRARAIENGCYVIAPAQVGRHPSGRTTWGHSLIIDPWGKPMAELPDAPGVLTAELDRADLSRVRQQLPVRAHRRDDLFS